MSKLVACTPCRPPLPRFARCILILCICSQTPPAAALLTGVEPGYVLVNDKQRPILGGLASTDVVSGARLCPMYYVWCVQTRVCACMHALVWCALLIVQRRLLQRRARAAPAATRQWAQTNQLAAPAACGLTARAHQPLTSAVSAGLSLKVGQCAACSPCLHILMRDLCHLLVAPPGMYWDGAAGTVAHCPSGTYKEVRPQHMSCSSALCTLHDASAARSLMHPCCALGAPRKQTWQKGDLGSCLSCGTGLWQSDKTVFLNKLDVNTGTVFQQVAVRGSSESCFIQRGMGAVISRSVMTGRDVLVASFCPANFYGIEAEKKYGRVATPCTACPAGLLTGQNAATADNSRATTYLVNDVSTPNPSATTGYYSSDACLTPAGWGFTSNNAQRCPQGFWNAGQNRLPCTK